ncbi:MAG: ribosome-associated translation inhibitor RaiA [Planctomycetes bacterium]|nr:ribosome-associated translation inhibitor RaiA [Planctomycetota bacterium]
MNIKITAKKIEIPQDIKEFAKEKLSKLEKFNQKVQGVEAVIKAEERSIVCELITHIDNREPVVIEVEGETIQAAVDLAVAKTERQLRKDKERDSARRRVNVKIEERDMPCSLCSEIPAHDARRIWYILSHACRLQAAGADVLQALVSRPSPGCRSG